MDKSTTSHDLFSKQSKEYSISRPTYPKSLFDFLLGLASRKELAWDCATGNGQAAVALSKYFRKVVASDISKKQIENARTESNIRYEVFPAEKATALEDNSVDLVTVAQALHWFNLKEFYREAKRVLRKDGGVIAAWAYGLHSINPEIDKVTSYLYEDVLGRYRPKEWKYMENRYEDLPFPFLQVPTPQFEIRLNWSLLELVDYLHTWSNVQKFLEENNNRDPLEEIHGKLEELWGDAKGVRQVVWPIYLKVGRITSA